MKTLKKVLTNITWWCFELVLLSVLLGGIVVVTFYMVDFIAGL